MIDLIQIVSWLCFIPGIIQVIRLLRKRKTTKHLSLKIIGNALFYEPFLAYELIKKAQKRYANFNKIIILGAGYCSLILSSSLIFVIGNSWYLVPAALGGLGLIIYQNYFRTKKQLDVIACDPPWSQVNYEVRNN